MTGASAYKHSAAGLTAPGRAVDDPPTSAADDRGDRGHLTYLDGLRGLAILAVVTIHASQHVVGLSQPLRDLTFYGIRGVQLFFVVSGFTLTMVHAGRPLEPLNFAARRFFRIAPMFYVGILLYLLLARFTAMPLSTRDATPVDVVATALFVHGWLPSAINTVVPGGWSIAAEAMFYLAFPLLLLLARHPRRLFAALVASYVVAGLTNIALRRLVGGPGGETLAVDFWLVQLPAFAGGCWLASLPRPGKRMRRIAPWAMALAALGLVADSQARGHSNLLIAVTLLLLLTWSAGAARPRWLESRFLVHLGQISFSVYIVHFAVLGTLDPLAAPLERALGATTALAVLIALALGIAGTIATVTYRWIEQPVIAATRELGRRRP